MSDPNFSDDKFNRTFAGMIIAMVALTAILMVLATVMSSDVTERLRAENEIENTKSIANRIAPVGQLTIGAVADAVIPSANAEALSGEQVYNKACVACHGAGVAGAPKLGDAAAWSARIAQGAEAMYENAINGFSGSAGYMPAKGGSPDLSDDNVKAAVDYMSDASK
ncbi:MAG: c-type cytochrome [Arenicella sp.]